MIEITESPSSPEMVVNRIKTNGSGCAVTYIGLNRGCSRGKSVLSVEYKDSKATAESGLRQIASKICQRWQLENIAIYHRAGKLKVGDINLVIVIVSAHRQESFAVCQYAVNWFKETVPTQKRDL
jgi:molybdopterin synthase catalytic subunit